MKPPKCRLCGELHWSNEPHKFATNTDDVRLTDATNRTLPATNAGTAKDGDTATGGLDAAGVPPALSVGKTPNRRSREAYNTYQREYMRKRRSGADQL